MIRIEIQCDGCNRVVVLADPTSPQATPVAARELAALYGWQFERGWRGFDWCPACAARRKKRKD